MAATKIKPQGPLSTAETTASATPVEPEFARPFLSDFKPWQVLWSGDAPLFPSEHAARWFMRSNRQRLAEIEAVAVYRREFLVHPARMAQVIERKAIEEFQSRAGVKP